MKYCDLKITGKYAALCFQSTESDLSWESDEVTSGNTNVSFTEFLKQYKELTDWLNQIQAVTRRNGSSHSERYLNQVGVQNDREVLIS